MNAPVLLAQLSGSTPQANAASPKNLKIEKPATSQAVSVHLDGSTRIDFSDVAGERLTFVRVGDKLIVLFDNQSTVTIEPVFDSSGHPLADIAFTMAADRTLNGDQFAELFPIGTDQSVLPAAGGNGPTAGANFSAAQVAALGDAAAPLALLGAESGGSGFDERPRDTALANPRPLAGVADVTGLNEDGLAGGNFSGVAPGTSSVTGALPVDFGTDAVGRSFSFAPDQSTLTALTSDGQAMHLFVTSVGGLPTMIGYVGGDPSIAANQVFTISLDAIDGSYTFTLLQPMDHPVFGAEDILNLLVNVIATDGSGDTTTTVIHVNVQDDVPVIVTVDQARPTLTDPEPGSISSQAGALGISWGADRFNDHADGGVSATTGHTGDRSVVFSDARVSATGHAGDAASAIAVLTSAGEVVHYALLNDGTLLLAYTGDAVPGLPGTGEGDRAPQTSSNIVFIVTLSDTTDTGGYVITQYRPLDHNSGEQIFESIALSFSLTATDSDGDAVSGTLTASITDTVASVGVVANQTVIESSGSPGELPPDGPSFLLVAKPGDDTFVTAGTGPVSLNIDWHADLHNPTPGAGLHDRSVVFTAEQTSGLAALGLTSDGIALSYDLSDDGQTLTASAGERPIFTVQLSDADNGSYDFTLLGNLDHVGIGSGDNIALTFTVRATDSDGDTVDQTFVVDVADSIPVAGAPRIELLEETGLRTILNVSLGIDWGADDVNDGANGIGRSVQFADTAMPANNVTATGPSSTTPVALFSNGNTVRFIVIDGTLVGYTGSAPTDIAAANIVFTVSLSDDGTGSYSFDLRGPLDHGAPDGAGHYLDLAFSYTATDSDHDSAPGSFAVRIDAAGSITGMAHDTIDYSTLSHDVIVDLGANTAAGADLGHDALGTVIVNAIGGGGNDTFIGGSEDNTLSGGAGGDVITGGKGNDTINAGGDDDTINYALGDGADTVDGGAGTDTLNVRALTGAAETYNINAMTLNGAPAVGINIEAGAGIAAATALNYEIAAKAVEQLNITAGDGADTVRITGGLADAQVAQTSFNVGTGAGNDTLDLTGLTSLHGVVSDGGADFDTVKFGYAYPGASHVEKIFGSDGVTPVGARITHVVNGQDVTDVVTNYESFQFTDGTRTLAQVFNTTPIAVSDKVTINEDTPLVFAASALTTNDTDADNDTLTVATVSGATHGTVSLVNGTVTFKADANYSGVAGFDYSVEDGRGGTATGHVTVDVAPVADAPAFVIATHGTPLASGSQFQVNSTTANLQAFSSLAALNDGGYVATWSSLAQDGSGHGIYGQRYDSTGAVAGGEFRINTYTAGDQWKSSVVALSEGGYVVTWTSAASQDGSGAGIYGQRYDANGAASGGEFRINATTAQSQTESAVAALANGGYVVTWTSYGQDGDGDGVFGRRYDSSGVASSEFRINTTTSGDQSTSSVAALSNGGFVVTWTSAYDQDGDSSGVYGQRYDASGVKAGGQFLVNTYTSFDQLYASVAGLTNGGYVVTWTSYFQDGDSFGVYGQRYDSSGAATGGEFRINTVTAGAQTYSSVTALADGGFLVTWQSADQANPVSGGIFGQRYDASGQRIGGEYLVNQITAGEQVQHLDWLSHTIIQLSNGNLVSTWEGAPLVNFTNEIYARPFTIGAVGAEDTAISLANVTVAVTDTSTSATAGGLETLRLVLSGFPAGATFSAGHAGTAADLGKWVIDDAAQIASLATTQLAMTPPQDYNGHFILSVSAVVTDTALLSGGVQSDSLTRTQTIDVTVTAVNDAPVTVADTVLTNVGAGASVIIPEWALVNNDTDADGDVLDVTSVGGTSGGTVSATAGTGNAGTVTFTDNATLSGSFTYRATDGTANGATAATVTVTNSTMSTTTLTGGNGGEIIIGRSGAANTLNGNGGNDVLIGNNGADILTGGTGADILAGGAGADTFNFVSGDTVIAIGGSGEKGTIAGFDVIRDFDTTVDKLNLSGTPAVATATAGTNGVNSTLTIGGAVVGSHAITNGIITFDDADAYSAPLSLTSMANVAAAVQYLRANDIGNALATVAFTATIGGTAHTFIYQQIAAAPGGDNDLLIDLAGVTIGNLGSLMGARIDPIILDLNHDGIALSSLRDGVQFDINADGVKDHMAWTAGHDGILAIDLDGSGRIENGTEIFSPDFAGGHFADGLAALAALDGNHDGRIDSTDAAFGKLLVWQDLNHNGVSEAGELTSLTSHDIASISLDAGASNGEIDGQAILANGTFNYTDGSTGNFVEVAFDVRHGAANGAARFIDAAHLTDADFAGHPGVTSLQLGDFTNSVMLGDHAAAMIGSETWTIDATAATSATSVLTVDGAALGPESHLHVLGGAGNDDFAGGAGNDILSGGKGNDTLKGGGGADTFVFGDAGPDHVDSILDYDAGQGDRIDLTGLLGSSDGDHLRLSNSGNNVILQVGTGGAANGAGWKDVAVLQDYHGAGTQVLVQIEQHIQQLTVAA